jgi:hypothetical protein
MLVELIQDCTTWEKWEPKEGEVAPFVLLACALKKTETKIPKGASVVVCSLKKMDAGNFDDGNPYMYTVVYEGKEFLVPYGELSPSIEATQASVREKVTSAAKKIS